MTTSLSYMYSQKRNYSSSSPTMTAGKLYCSTTTPTSSRRSSQQHSIGSGAVAAMTTTSASPPSPLLSPPRASSKNMEFVTHLLSCVSLVVFVILMSMVIKNQIQNENQKKIMINTYLPSADYDQVLFNQSSHADNLLLQNTSASRGIPTNKRHGTNKRKNNRGKHTLNHYHETYNQNIDDSWKPHPYFRELVHAQRQSNINNGEPLPKPIINVGFPKAGTTSLWKYFECGARSHVETSSNMPTRTNTTMIRLSNMTHDKCDTNYDWKTHDRLDCGFCIRDAISKGLPPLRSCGNFDAYFQLDVEKFHDCSFPQVEYLHEIHNEYPHATFVMTLRNPKHWYQSLVRFRKYNERIGQCNSMTTLYPNNTSTTNTLRGPGGSSYEALKTFFSKQVEHVRSFVLQYPTHALIEIDAEDSIETPKYLENVFGIQQSCWGNKNKNTKKQRQKRMQD